MTSEIILIDLIDWPKVTKEERTRDRDFVKKLALTIQTQGQLQPIVVRPNPEKKGRFIGVIGWHRASAIGDILKRPEIEAKVIVDMDAEEAAIATIAENLFRNPLSKAQTAVAVRKWHDQYDRKRQEQQAALASAKKADKPAARKPKPSATPQVQIGPEPVEPPNADVIPFESPAEPAPAVEAAEPIPSNFAAHVSAITGQSKTTVKRSLKIGQVFNDDQLTTFEQCGVGQVWMETIADIADAGKRDAIVNLIASGLDAKAAIAQANETPEVKTAGGAVYEVAPPAEPGEKPEDQMSGLEWVEAQCGEKLAMFSDPAVKANFHLHALLYRVTRAARQDFKVKVKKAMTGAKSDGLSGGLYSLINRFSNIAHPKHWLLCGACNSTGFIVSGDKQSKCRECSGNGFVVKIEGK